MPLTTNAVRKNETNFTSPFRMILSGSSGAGKTHFAGELLQNNIFDSDFEYIYYFHPCYLEEAPVNWHDTMMIPVSYQTGLPSLEQLMSMPTNSVVVLDDLMNKCIDDEVIDQLFRVISGKRKISVMIMTQNYFAQGKYGRNIRNSCNYSVLLSNCCDATINLRAVRANGIDKAVCIGGNKQCRNGISIHIHRSITKRQGVRLPNIHKHIRPLHQMLFKRWNAVIHYTRERFSVCF